MTDSLDLAAAKRLLDAARNSGFRFERIAPGEDGPLLGVRQTEQWRDEVYLAGFSQACRAIRRRRSSLVVPGGLPIAAHVRGDALTGMRRRCTRRWWDGYSFVCWQGREPGYCPCSD